MEPLPYDVPGYQTEGMEPLPYDVPDIKRNVGNRHSLRAYYMRACGRSSVPFRKGPQQTGGDGTPPLRRARISNGMSGTAIPYGHTI